MRSYTVWLQGGHTPRGLCSPCTLSSPPTHSHHFTALYLHDCRVLCRVLTITALVLSCTGNTNPPHRPLLESHYWATHTCTWLIFSLPLCLTWHLACCLSHTNSATSRAWRREEDGWHVSWREADSVICYNSALISIFLNLCGDLCALPERASILTEPWPASTLPVSHDRCFLWPPDGGHMSLSQAWLILHSQLLCYYHMNILIAIHILQPRTGVSKSAPFLRRNLKRPEGTKWRKEWMGAWQDVFTAVMVMN